MCTCLACGIVYAWCRVHAVCVVLCTCGIVYTLYNGVVCMWHCVHVVQVALCTCDVVHTFCKWCGVQVVLCTCCIYGIGARVVMCACGICCVVGLWYYICALCSHGIMTCVHGIMTCVFMVS